MKQNIVAELPDGRDHVLYLLDGPALTNYINSIFLTEEQLSSLSSPRSGDEVVMFGSGLGAYPPRALYGYIDGKMYDADLSDVDRAQGIQYLVLAVSRGDSGSAVYDLRTGKIVGLLTYGLGLYDADTAQRGISFALAFPPDAEARLEALQKHPVKTTQNSDSKKKKFTPVDPDTW
jgi:hypothetical protein